MLIIYHLDDFDFGLDTQMVQEHFQVLLHLNRVVLHLGDGKNAHFAVLPCAMLLEQERQKHQQTTIVDDPPDVDVAADL